MKSSRTPPMPGTPVEAVLAIEGEFDRVVIRHCTLDPGGERARLVADTCTPDRVRRARDSRAGAGAVIESSIVGPIREVTDDTDPCSVGRSRFAILSCKAFRRYARHRHARRRGDARARDGIRRCRGESARRERGAHSGTRARARQSARLLSLQRNGSPPGSTAAAPVRVAPFRARDSPTFLQPRAASALRAFAQLSKTAPASVATGAENGSEMGAFSGLLNPIKRRDLERKVIEFMPFGLIPQFIFET